MEKEQLTTPASEARFALNQRGEALPMLTGYAIVWGALTDDRGGYKARFAKGSVRTPDDRPVLALYHHDGREILGSTANGTLRLRPDDHGLRVEIDPPDTTYARDVVELVRRGDVAGMSFGMYPEEWADAQEAGQTVRTFTRFLLDEVTITASPAVLKTSVQAVDYAAAEPQTPERDAQAVRIEEYHVGILEAEE